MSEDLAGEAAAQRLSDKPGGSDNSSCSLPSSEGFLHRDLLFAEVSENFL